MKGFFARLFGGESTPKSPKRRDQAAPVNLPKPQPSLTPGKNKRSDLKPGDFIAGEYRIRRVFGGEGGADGEGKSGMGVVYLVEARTSEEPFVLKTFQSKLANVASIARFKAEADIWINIGKHANIVQCHWVREFSDQLFVAAEYIGPDNAGRNTLTHHLASGSLSLQQQLHWIAQFCFGMKHAMTHGLRAHRDIKPDNLMIDNRGRLKITDFGLAKGLSPSEQSASLQVTEGRNETLTLAGSAFGTAPYMAPEQFMDSSAVDHRADIYSLGIVIYMMISGGRLPILPAGGSGWAMAHHRQRVPRIEHPLMQCAEKCLEKDRRNRFQTYDELLDAVRAACRKHAISIPTEEQDVDSEFQRQWSIAMSLTNLGRAEEAITKLLQMANRWPESSQVYTELGRAYKILRKLPEALQATEKSLLLYPYSTAAWNNLGGILADLQRFADAKNAFLKSLRIESENTGAMVSLAELHMDDGQLEEAKHLCELALFWRPEKPNVLLAASSCLMRCGETKRARELLEKLVLLPFDSTEWLSDFKRRRSWFNLARCRHSLGDAEGCMQALQEVLKHFPNDEASLTFVAQVLAETGKSNEALSYLDKSLAIDPQSTWAWNNRSVALNNLGRNAEALGCCDRALAIDSKFAAAWFNKGNALVALARNDEALDSYGKALAIDARNANAWVGNGNVLDMLGRSDEAIACYDKALAIEPRNGSAWSNKGVTLNAKGRHEEALACYDEALQIKPLDGKLWCCRANALYRLERYQEALVCLQKAQKLGDPTAAGKMEYCQRQLSSEANKFFTRGFELEMAGNNAEAIRCYDAGIAIDGSNAAVWMNKGNILIKLGQREEAIRCYDKSLAIEPRNAGAWGNMAITLGDLGRHEEALACCNKALQLDPRTVSFWCDKGTALANLERYEEAILCFQEAQKLGHPTAARKIEYCRRQLSPSADTFYRRGNGFREAGNNVEAIRCYDAGIAIDGSNVDLWLNKGAALLALKRYPEAVACFDRVISLNADDFRGWNNKGVALISMGQREQGFACLIEAKKLEKR